jgi:hypothetical protein
MMIVAITQTCFALPSQWEGKFADGRYFYAKYRHGKLRLCVSTVSVEEAVKRTPLLEKTLDSAGRGGVLSTASMLDHIGATLDSAKLTAMTKAEQRFAADCKED